VQLVAKKKDETIRVRAEDHFVKICHDELIALMGPVDTSLSRARKGVTGIMMWACRSRQDDDHASSRESCKGRLQGDARRGGRVSPGAVHQLKVAREKLGVPVFLDRRRQPGRDLRDATDTAAAESYDFVIYDTAGRLTIDAVLMQELEDHQDARAAVEHLLVIDAMIARTR
jgi:signal recognition particle subunit SRP54